MAMIERRPRLGHPPRSKPLLRGLPMVPTHGRRLLVAMTAAIACAVAAGCDGGHQDGDARAHAGDAAPMLPGTRGAAAAVASAGAQRFDDADGAQAHAASDALLPPVMHTAD